MSAPRRWSLTSPAVVFPALAVALILAALLRPAEQREDSRLTSYSAAPNGAKALFDIAGRLGWRPVRRDRPLTGPLDRASTYLVLAPVKAVTPEEAHRLLDAVRGGAGLMLAVSEDEGLTESITDSLHLSFMSVGFHELSGGSAEQPVPAPDESASDDEDDEAQPAANASAGCRTARGVGTDYVRRVMRRRDHGDAPADTLLGATFGNKEVPAALGTTLGLGRVVVIAEPDLLRNDVLRLCGGAQAPQRPGVRAVRFLEAAAPAGGTLVFDEWHQGYGQQPEEVGALSYALGRTGWGRALGVAILAALLWLWSAGARVLVPVERARVERRSPLEHVGALARAYEQVGASRTVVRRMVRGLRRRHPSAARRGSDDAAFLDGLADRRPELASAVALVRQGTELQLAAADLPRVADAIDTIDAALANPAPPAGRSRGPA